MPLAGSQLVGGRLTHPLATIKSVSNPSILIGHLLCENLVTGFPPGFALDGLLCVAARFPLPLGGAAEHGNDDEDEDDRAE